MMKTDADKSAVVSYIEALCTESDTPLWRESCERARRNDELFVGAHWDRYSLETEQRMTINRLQNAVIAAAAIQSEEPPKTTLVAMENLEPPVYFLNTKLDTPATPELQAFLASMPPETYQEGLNGEPPRALKDEEVAIVEQAIMESQQISQMMGTPVSIPSDILMGVNDTVAANTLNTINAAMAARAGEKSFVRENMLLNLKFGWQFGLYEWDDEKQAPRISNVHFRHVRVDPNATKIDDASYAIHYQYVDEHKAKSAYPTLKSKIDEYSKDGNLGSGEDIGERYSSVQYARKMVCIKTAWIRNVPFFFTEAEALATGRVTKQTVENRKPITCNCGLGDAYEAIDEHAVDCPKRVAYEGALAAVMADGGDVTAVIAPSEIIEQVEQYANKDGEICKPNGENWPIRYGIAQARILEDELVDYRECEFADIPLLHNVNIPYSFCPWGQGEPERLEPIQKALNDIMTSIVTQYRLHEQPIEVVPTSINEALPSFARDVYSYKPGVKWIVPDHLVIQFGGKFVFAQDPPKIPTDAWRMIELLIRLMDEESGHNEVLQGRAASSWSGEAISTLQKAAKGSIGWKSQSVEPMLIYLTRLKIHDIVNRMTDDEKMRYVSKYPVQVWYAISQRLKSLDVDVSVEISSGSGAVRQGQRASDLSLYDRKLLSPQSTLEGAGKDPKVEMNNWQSWNRMMRDIGASQNEEAGLPPQQSQEAETPVVGGAA
jgi:hypothetical protein